MNYRESLEPYEAEEDLFQVAKLRYVIIWTLSVLIVSLVIMACYAVTGV